MVTGPRPWFRRRSIESHAANTSSGVSLNRTLGAWHLVALGVGGIVGAGIFSTVGSAAAGGSEHLGAGPAIVISFILVAITCALAGLCYAEFAAMVPTAGSAYTYAYATLGELAAWTIGWDLLLEYAVGNVAVAISWSGYFQELLRGLGWNWPIWLGVDYRSAVQAAATLRELVAAGGDPATLAPNILRAAEAWNLAPGWGAARLVFNLPASGIVLLLTAVLVCGIHHSARLNAALVILKVAIVVFFIAAGSFYVQPDNWQPFAPNGWKGIGGAAAIIFFAYIGFDAITTTAEETRNPQRDLPRGILGSLAVCTVLYVAVAIVLTGMEPWDRLGGAEPLAAAFSARGVSWAAGVVSVGAVIATASVLFVFQLGQPRILFAMARDGLLPPWAAKVHPRFRTPARTTVLTGGIVALFAGLANIDEVVELTNIGTLFAFGVVAVGVVVLRRIEPERERPFRVPWVPLIPMAALASCLYLMFQLPWITWMRFGIWMGIGFVIYLIYGQKRSRLGQKLER